MDTRDTKKRMYAGLREAARVQHLEQLKGRFGKQPTSEEKPAASVPAAAQDGDALMDRLKQLKG